MPGSTHPRPLAFGPFQVLPEQRQLLKDGQPVRIGSRTFDLLVALASHPGEIQSQRALLDQVWPGAEVEETSLRVHVANLRALLHQSDPGVRYVINVPARGYCFVGQVDTAVARESRSKVGVKLPAHLTPLIGRASDLARMKDALVTHRLVTIVGAGGVGKSKLAMEMAAGAGPDFPDGCCCVDLSRDDRRPPSLSQALAAKLGAAGEPSNLPGLLTKRLQGLRLLLVIDAHLTIEGDDLSLLKLILQRAPSVRMILTCREPLGLDGEHVHQLRPLGLPATDFEPTAMQAIGAPAVQLFVQRALACDSRFVFDDSNAAAVARLCIRLNGLPLGIEIAASHLASIGVHGLLHDLTDSNLIDLSWRSELKRHRSLRRLSERAGSDIFFEENRPAQKPASGPSRAPAPSAGADVEWTPLAASDDGRVSRTRPGDAWCTSSQRNAARPDASPSDGPA
jgi:DNA-binding winged helix-turn-helix (wHTH) protein